MGTVIAIGGMTKGIENLKKICQKIVDLSKKENPRILYVPTANNDHEQYSAYMSEFFEENYSCSVDTLWLLGQQLNIEKMDEKIKEADIVFVEGGNLVVLLETWRKYKVDEKLKEAYENGVIMSGISAGANCWFEYSYSDSVKGKKFSLVKGLGIVKGGICPHYNNEERKKSFNCQINDIKSICSTIYAVEEDNAIIIDDSGALFLSDKRESSIEEHILNLDNKGELEEID